MKNKKSLIVLMLSLVTFSLLLTIVIASGGVYSGSKHGNTDSGVYRIDTEDRGSCSQCHLMHSSSGPHPYGLFAANDNNLCYTSNGVGPCHTNQSPITNPIYMGQTIYETDTAGAKTGHAKNTNCYWRGLEPPGRASSDFGKCLNCHNPHGRAFAETSDPTGGPYNYTADSMIPNKLTRLEENLCFGCHDGTVADAKNVKSQFTTTPANASPTFYKHPVTQGLTYSTPSYHTANEAKALTAINRHVECADCHNPHYAQNNGTWGVSTHSAGTNLLSQALLGIYGVLVSSWPTAAVGSLPNSPTFTLSQLTSTTTHYEWNLCLRCHSSYSVLPTFAPPNNVTDISREINPNNLSHHAVVATGKNQSNNANYLQAFEYLDINNPGLGRWGPSKKVYCSDCHSTATVLDTVKGPHGSTQKWIVGKFYKGGGMMIICYKCHRDDVYSEYGANRSLSRFNHGRGTGDHWNETYNAFGIACLNCHGGSIEGGIHGTNAGVGSQGTSNLGEHFMNGACIGGFTAGAAGQSNSGKCWTRPIDGVYNTGCHEHPLGKNFTPNYDY